MAESGQPVRADPFIPPSDGSCKITKLPSEVHQNIFENITNQAHLLNLMVTCKDLKAPAEAVLWEKCNMGGYAKLLTLPAEKQHYYMTKVRELTFDIRTTGSQPGELQLYPPRLTTLRIRHLSPLSPNTLNMPVKVGDFITPKMIEVNIRNGTTENFIPALYQALNLKRLCIGPRVRAKAEGCDEARFSRLVRSLPFLVELEAGPLSSRRLLWDVADHACLEKFYISSSKYLNIIDNWIVHRALQNPQPFQQLKAISIGMEADAATLLLPHLPQLSTLMIHIGPGMHPVTVLAMLDFIKAIGAKQKLTRLHLAIVGTRTTIHMADLAPLKNLILLEDFAFCYDIPMAYSPSYYEHPISELSPLRHLACDFPQVERGFFLNKLALHHPNLQTFLYRRQLRVNDMSARFPELQTLEVGSTDIPLTESNVDTAIQTLATKLISVAPKLRYFRIGRPHLITTEIHFDHRPNSIFCTCRHEWNNNLTFAI